MPRIMCKYCGAEAVTTEVEHYMFGRIFYSLGFECPNGDCENQSTCSATYESCKDNGYSLCEDE